MEDLVRDTVFGQLVRLISRNKLLRYPDELDHSLWRQFIQGESVSGAEKGSSDEVEKYTHLVTWQGQDDLEVTHFLPSEQTKTQESSQASRIHRIGQTIANCW